MMMNNLTNARIGLLKLKSEKYRAALLLQVRCSDQHDHVTRPELLTGECGGDAEIRSVANPQNV